MKLDIDTVTQIVYVALAAAGGMTRYLYSYIETGRFKFAIFCAHVFVSAFSGFMFAEFGTFMGVKETGLFLFAGIGGFMGTKALELIEKKIVTDYETETKKKNTKPTNKVDKP